MLHPVAENDDEPQLDVLKLVNAELTARIARQDASMTRVETKAVVTIGFAVAAAQFLATRDLFKSPLSILFGLLAFMAYLLAFAIGIWSIRVAKFADLEGSWLLGLAEQPHVNVLRKLSWSRKNVVDQNKKAAERKARLWWRSLGLLTAGLVSSVLCVVQTA